MKDENDDDDEEDAYALSLIPGDVGDESNAAPIIIYDDANHYAHIH